MGVAYGSQQVTTKNSRHSFLWQTYRVPTLNIVSKALSRPEKSQLRYREPPAAMTAMSSNTLSYKLQRNKSYGSRMKRIMVVKCDDQKSTVYPRSLRNRSYIKEGANPN